MQIDGGKKTLFIVNFISMELLDESRLSKVTKAKALFLQMAMLDNLEQ